MSGELPKAISESTMQVGSVTLRVYHLDDGRRIINGDDVVELFSGDLSAITPEQAAALVALHRADGGGA